MLNSITIRRFKNINEVTLPLERINVLIGSNNSGKSSILQAAQFGISVSQTMKLLAARWQKETSTLSFAPSQLVYSPMREVIAIAHKQHFTERVNSAIEVCMSEVIEKVSNSDQEPQYSEISTTIRVIRGRGQNIQCTISGAELGKKLQPISPPFSVFVPGLAGIPLVEEQKSAVAVRRSAARGDANNVFRNVLWQLKQNDAQWKQFNEDFQRVFPEREVYVAFDPENDEYIQASLTSKGSRFPIDAAGTGVLQAIQILAYINLSQPKLLILDEPDAHLHPNNQRRLAEVLIELAEERSFQILLSTHSRHLLDEFRNDAKIHWIRDGIRVADDQYSNVEVLLDVGALDKGDLLKAGKIKCIVLTEDDDVSLIRTLLEAAGFLMDEMEIWPYKGCSNQDTALALCSFIREHAPAACVVIHRDRDYMTPDEVADYESYIKKGSPTAFVFVTEGTDAESYFLDEQHLKKIEGNLSQEEAKELIEQATKDTAEYSKAVFINSRTPIEAVRLRKENRQPNPGALATACYNAYDGDSIRYRHGKKVLRRLRLLLQTEKLTTNIIQKSDHVRPIALVAIAQKIWNQPAQQQPAQ